MLDAEGDAADDQLVDFIFLEKVGLLLDDGVHEVQDPLGIFLFDFYDIAELFDPFADMLFQSQENCVIGVDHCIAFGGQDSVSGIVVPNFTDQNLFLELVQVGL